jgi:hypothetical protein
MITCDFGCGQAAIHTFKTSKKNCCSISVNSCPEMKRKNSLSKIDYHPFRGKQHPRGMLGKRGMNQFTKAKQEGRTHVVTDETKLKLSESSKNRKHSAKTKNKMSEITKARHAAGWNPVCGRAKKYEYISLIAGHVSLDGTWELMVAKYLDSIGVTWKRNKNKFVYIHLNGKDSTYTPDFYVKEWDSYIEVKGYETELDRCKWKQFPHKLLVWKKEKINEIKNMEV